MSLHNVVRGEIFIRLFKGETGRRPGRRRRGVSTQTWEGSGMSLPATGAGTMAPLGLLRAASGSLESPSIPPQRVPNVPRSPGRGRCAAKGVGALRVRAAACSQLIPSEQGHRDLKLWATNWCWQLPLGRTKRCWGERGSWEVTGSLLVRWMHGLVSRRPPTAFLLPAQELQLQAPLCKRCPKTRGKTGEGTRQERS